MTRSNWNRTIFGAALFLLTAGAVWAAGGSSSTPEPSVPAADPRVTAMESYNRGIRNRDDAWELEAKLAEASEGERAKLEKKIDKAYNKAIRAYEAAIRAVPDFYQAHASLGYALRRTGEYEDSIKAYDRALEIEPRYGQAIEYRAEAYLGLGKIDEAKEAYMVLFRGDRELAAQLLAAMEKWVDERREDPSGVDPEQVETFASWVEERAALDEQAALTPGDDSGAYWQPADDR